MLKKNRRKKKITQILYQNIPTCFLLVFMGGSFAPGVDALGDDLSSPVVAGHLPTAASLSANLPNISIPSHCSSQSGSKGVRLSKAGGIRFSLASSSARLPRSRSWRPGRRSTGGGGAGRRTSCWFAWLAVLAGWP